MLQVIPDWHQTGMLDELEAYVGNGLLLRSGPGFYLSDTDTLLLTANCVDEVEALSRVQPDDRVYTLYVWNVPFLDTILGTVASIRTRRDSRT